MIKNSAPLSMIESEEYVKKDESETEIVGFMKKFEKLNVKDAKEMRKELEGLDMLKMRPEYLVKIIDLLPENAEELNKIFIDATLDEDESRKILDIVQKYK